MSDILQMKNWNVFFILIIIENLNLIYNVIDVCFKECNIG